MAFEDKEKEFNKYGFSKNNPYANPKSEFFKKNLQKISIVLLLLFITAFGASVIFIIQSDGGFLDKIFGKGESQSFPHSLS